MRKLFLTAITAIAISFLPTPVQAQVRVRPINGVPGATFRGTVNPIRINANRFVVNRRGVFNPFNRVVFNPFLQNRFVQNRLFLNNGFNGYGYNQALINQALVFNGRRGLLNGLNTFGCAPVITGQNIRFRAPIRIVQPQTIIVAPQTSCAPTSTEVVTTTTDPGAQYLTAPTAEPQTATVVPQNVQRVIVQRNTAGCDCNGQALALANTGAYSCNQGLALAINGGVQAPIGYVGNNIGLVGPLGLNRGVYGLGLGLNRGFGLGLGLNRGFGLGLGLNRGFGFGFGLNRGFGLGLNRGFFGPGLGLNRGIYGLGFGRGLFGSRLF